MDRMTLLDFCTWLENTTFSLSIAESDLLFPIIETVHVLALVLVFGSIAMLDLRLLGVSSRDRGILQLAGETLPWTWSAFVVAAISGSLMFASAATSYYDNIPFRIKIALLMLVGLNMLIFHLTAWKSAEDWNQSLPTPRAARIAAGLSLIFWVGVIFAGRWIGFV
jgi:hypothetical protein